MSHETYSLHYDRCIVEFSLRMTTKVLTSCIHRLFYRQRLPTCILTQCVLTENRIHRLHLCKGVRLPPSECPVILVLWEIRSTSSLPSLSGPLGLEVVAPDRVLSMGQVELNCTYAKLNCLK